MSGENQKKRRLSGALLLLFCTGIYGLGISEGVSTAPAYSVYAEASAEGAVGAAGASESSDAAESMSAASASSEGENSGDSADAAEEKAESGVSESGEASAPAESENSVDTAAAAASAKMRGNTGTAAAEEREKKYRWLLAHKDLFSDGKVEASEHNGDLIDFMYSYAKGIGEVPEERELTDEDFVVDGTGIPALYQWDARWGYEKCGDSVIGLAGCGPTCMSMVAVGLTGDRSYTPDYVADYASSSGYYVDSVGTSWAFLTNAAGYFGLESETLMADENVVLRKLDEGDPIIASMGPGVFTTEGHYIVLVRERDGWITIRDPNNRALSAKVWKFEDLLPQIRNLWCFEMLESGADASLSN